MTGFASRNCSWCLWGIFDLFFKETDMGSTVLKENGEFFTKDELTAMKAAIHQHTFNHVPWPWHGHVGLDVQISRLSKVDLGPIAAIAVVASLRVVMKLSLSFTSIGMSSGIDDSRFVLTYTRQVKMAEVLQQFQELSSSNHTKSVETYIFTRILTEIP